MEIHSCLVIRVSSYYLGDTNKAIALLDGTPNGGFIVSDEDIVIPLIGSLQNEHVWKQLRADAECRKEGVKSSESATKSVYRKDWDKIEKVRKKQSG